MPNTGLGVVSVLHIICISPVRRQSLIADLCVLFSFPHHPHLTVNTHLPFPSRAERKREREREREYII